MNRAKILVVDDRPENLLAFGLVLSDIDADIVNAASGEEALEKVKTNEFSIALLDIQMPDMDGYELAELIRKDEKHTEMPIFFISSIFAKDFTLFPGAELGPVDFMQRPFKNDLFLIRIRTLVEYVRMKKQLEELKLMEK
ncbi:response regulator [Spirochaeta cellobiosiphila]|uniref:response regulator n=1 Tax=Spirochaeta cellobiosiphila TaxID=504483 RepID=UPI000425DA33|nr:response regulator [Spirochaeta cellobiosiphila]